MKTKIEIELPEDVALALREKWGAHSQHTVETGAIEGYRTQTLSADQVRRTLNFQTRMLATVSGIRSATASLGN
jgi:hypothetical protein